MNKTLTSMIATLLVLQLGIVTAQTTGDESATPQSTPASVEPAPVATENAPAADKMPDPITGAFGIPLGKRFDPSMVAKVIEEKPHTFPGPNGEKRQGTLLRFESSKPDEHFQSYALKTTKDGIIYAIRGEYQFPVEQAKGKQVGIKKQRLVRANCKKTVKALAKELETRHGKPRGVGWDGEWFAFRQRSEGSDLSLRLYANRCRTGMYSIVYTDNNARRGKLPGKAALPLTPNSSITDNAREKSLKDQ